MNIYVGNFPWATTEEELQAAFKQYGELESVTIIRDKFTGKSKGFGFILIQDDAQAQAAIDALHGKEWNGRMLTVNQARPRTENRQDERPTRGEKRHRKWEPNGNGFRREHGNFQQQSANSQRRQPAPYDNNRSLHGNASARGHYRPGFVPRSENSDNAAPLGNHQYHHRKPEFRSDRSEQPIGMRTQDKYGVRRQEHRSSHQSNFIKRTEPRKDMQPLRSTPPHIVTPATEDIKEQSPKKVKKTRLERKKDKGKSWIAGSKKTKPANKKKTPVKAKTTKTKKSAAKAKPRIKKTAKKK